MFPLKKANLPKGEEQSHVPNTDVFRNGGRALTAHSGTAGWAFFGYFIMRGLNEYY
jgi:hypothetical protein